MPPWMRGLGFKSLARVQKCSLPPYNASCVTRCCGLSQFSQPRHVTIDGKTFETDEWTNVPDSILSVIPRRLHLQQDHPLSITRQLIESNFPGYKLYNSLSPVVSVSQNFDSLGFPPTHPGRSRADTYYINKDTVLRTHTSAHQAETFRENASDGYLITADVYRRDAVDRSHYPVFHQVEGARTWNRREKEPANLNRLIADEITQLPQPRIVVEDPNPTIHHVRNPLQKEHHTPEEVEAIAVHLKRCLEDMVAEIFHYALKGAVTGGDPEYIQEEPVKVRWVEAYFPFTSPSWELEVFWQGDWLEILGCGVVKQELLVNAGVPDRIGWAFGLGLERIAMLLFSIPDIRLFWSQDPRFLSQFRSGPTPNITRFTPYSKHPACYKDVAFWVPEPAPNVVNNFSSSVQAFHENDMMELVRGTAGDDVEEVKLVDKFIHPTNGRRSLCYRISYRSLNRTLTNQEANELHELVKATLTDRFGVEIR